MHILFVCLGNICRSPTAEAIFRTQVQRAGLAEFVCVDSAGTGAWHQGQPPDPRARQAARQRGYSLDALRARQITQADFDRFDLILAMDQQNGQDIQSIRPSTSRAEVDLYLRRFGLADGIVPDPYYGGSAGFERVLDLLESAGAALLAEVRRRL